MLLLGLRESAISMGKRLAGAGIGAKWRLHVSHTCASAMHRMSGLNFDLILVDLNVEEVRARMAEIVAAAGATLVYGLCDDEHGEFAVAARRDGAADVLSMLHLQGPSTARLLNLMLEGARSAGNARLLAAAVEGAPVAYAISDALQPDIPLIYVNEHFVSLTGYEPRDVIGRNCRFLQGPQTDSRDIDRIREAIRRAQPLYIELFNYRKDGQPFWNGMLLRPIRSANGTVTHFVATLRDMSERRQTQESLERSARLHRLLVAASGGMTLFTGADGQLRAPLAEFEAFTALRYEDYRSGDWSAAVHSEDRSLYAAAREVMLSAPTKQVSAAEVSADSSAHLGHTCSFRLWHAPSRQWRFVELRVLPVRDSAGLLTEWVGTLTDVNDRMSSAQAQQQGQRFLQHALDALPSRILFVDRDAIVRWVNRSCTEWLGLSAAQLSGKALLELTDAAGRQTLPPRMQEVLAGQSQRFSAALSLGARQTNGSVELVPYRPEQLVAGFFLIASDAG
jgi:PAS domain S-box-containing protein